MKNCLKKMDFMQIFIIHSLRMLLRKRIWDVVVWRHPFFVQILPGMEFIFVPDT